MKTAKNKHLNYNILGIKLKIKQKNYELKREIEILKELVNENIDISKIKPIAGELREYQLKAGEKLSAPLEKGPCIWLLFSGELEQTGCLSFSKAPDAFFQKPGEKGEFIARTHVRLFRASSEL